MTKSKFWIVSRMSIHTAEIFLYGYIDTDDVNANDFIKEFRQLEKEYTNIHVRINSGGGSVFEGLAIYNAMQQSPANIETWVDGLAASMASIIALAGKKCHMSKSAMMMTHKPSGVSYGNSEQHKNNAQLLESIEQTMLSIYAAKTTKTKSECALLFMNGNDNWFNAEEAISVNLVDDIYDSPAIEMPKEKVDEKKVWGLYNQQKFAAIFNQTDSSSTEKTKGVNEQLDEALTDKIINSDQYLDLKNTFKNAPERLQVALKLLYSQRTETLSEKTWIELDEAGELEEYKQRDFEGFKRKFELQYDKPYNGSAPKKQNDGDPDFFDSAKTKRLADKSYWELDRSGELEEYKQRDIEGFKRKFFEEFGKEYKK